MNTIALLGAASMAFVAAFTYRACMKQAGVGQSPRSAILEAWFNIVIGFTTNFAANVLLIPMMSGGGHLSLANNFWGGWIYTTISIVRTYAIRRWFNARLHAAAKRLAGE